MKLTFSKISSGDNVLFYYHAGSGGEFIAKTFSKHHPAYNELPSHMNEKTNQCHSVSSIMYSSQWPDRDNPETWVNPNYNYDETISWSNHVLKDHPNDYNLELYETHFPHLSILYLNAHTEQEWFARLAFAKLGKKIEAPITPHFIRKEVNDLLTPEQEHEIIAWSGQYHWVWAHEIMICNSKLAEGASLSEFKHEDSIDKYIEDHVEQDKRYQYELGKRPGHYPINVNIDQLVYDSKSFWNIMAQLYPSLEVDKCVHDTDKWILNNHRLLINNGK